MGLQVAIQAAKKRSVSSVVLIEKEQAPGLHASGRNSGVLHAGLYYPPHSLKAKLTPRGNRLLRKYCADNGIPVNACGKLVVARDQSLVKQLDLLFERARVNGAVIFDVFWR
jgi:L-2-hydroxyglutarate oxidase LhgO